MTRGRRLALTLGSIVILPLLAGMIVVLVLADTRWGNERVRRLLVSQANRKLNGELTIGSLRGGLLSHATLTDVQLVDSLRGPLFGARRVRVRYALLPALRGKVVLTSVVLDTPSLRLDRPPGARWNFQSLVRQAAAPKDSSRGGRSAPPEIHDVRIVHGSIVYRRPWTPDTSLAPDRQATSINNALAPNARSRTERVPGGYQRVLEYRDLDAFLPEIRLARHGEPMMVRIASLSMHAMPYRPPAIDVRSLTGTLYGSKDSLWWRGAQMALPASRVSGDGTIRFHRGGFRMELAGAPVAFADLRWLSPKLPAEGGGRLRFAMRVHGDTSELALSDADLRLRDATVAGAVTLLRLKAREAGHSTTLVRGADLTVTHLRTALLHELVPSVKLPRTGTLDGRVRVDGSSNALRLDADVRFADAAAGRSHLLAKGGIGFANGITARDLAVQVRPLQLGTVRGAAHLPIGGVLSGDALLNGSTRTGWQVRADLTHVDAGQRSHVRGAGRWQRANGRIAGDARLDPLSLVTVGRFAPAAQLRGSVVGRVHVDGTTHSMRVSGDLASTSGGGSARGTGTVMLAGDRTRYDVAVALDALDARRFTARAPSTSLTGRIAARGVGTRPATAEAVVSADLVRSRFDTLAVDRLLARLAASRGLLRVDTLDVAARGASARASGSIGLVESRSGTLRFAVDADSLGALRRWLGSSDTTTASAAPGRQSVRLAVARADSARRADAVRIERLALGLPEGVQLVPDTLPGIRRDSLAGSLHATGTIRGSVPAPAVDARLQGRGIVARGYAVNELDATIRTPNVRTANRSVLFRVDAAGVQAQGYGFEHVSAEGGWAGHRLTTSLQVRQDSLVSYAALGSYAHPEQGVHDLRLDSLRARFDTVVWRLARPGRVLLSHGDLRADSVRLASSIGESIALHGVMPKTGPMNVLASVDGLRVSTVLRAMQRDSIADARLSATVRLLGTRAAPRFSGQLRADSTRYRGALTERAVVDFSYESMRLSLTARATDSAAREILSARASLPLNLALEKVTGSRKVPGALTADVVLDSLRLEALPFPSRKYSELRGVLAGDARVRGSWAQPEYAGRGALRRGGLTVNDIGFRLADAVADLHLAGDTLRLDSLVANAKGQLRAYGTVNLADRSHPFVRLEAGGRDLRVFDTPRGLMDVDGELHASGPLDSVRVTGRAELLGGFLALKQFNKNLLRVKAPGDPTFFSVFDTTTSAADRAEAAAARARPHRVGVIADLSVVVDRGNYYRNRPDANTEFYTGEGEEVRAHIDTRAGEQWAVGFVRIGDGVAIFRTRPFTPARGTLTFLPQNGGAGFVEQVGEREVWEPGRGLFAVQLLTGATSKSPAIGLESGTLFPIRGRELNGYLTLGRDHTSLLQQSGSSLSGSATWSGQLSGESGALARRQQAATALGVVVHDLGTGATKEFGLDAFGVSPADVPTELVFGKTGGVRGALVEGGQYVTPDLYLAGELRMTRSIPGVRLSRRYGDRWRVDVGIEPRFLFRAPTELGITHPTVRTGTFGAFLTRMWRW